MYKIGRLNKLKIIKELDFGMYLQAGIEEILLPKRYIPEGASLGDELTVFLYRDSEDRLIATTEEPYIMVDEFALLEVVDTNKYGVFMNWGLPKDLFIPFQEQNGRMAVGRKYVVRAYIDDETERIVASARIEKFLEKDTSALTQGQKIKIIPFKYTDLGVKCMIDSKYEGMLFRNQIFGKVDLGVEITAFIDEIRPDGKVNISLKQKDKGIHFSNIEHLILDRFKANNVTVLPFHDKSSPESIFEEFGISKRDFKQSIGSLYKKDIIKISDSGIELL